ncbi:polysaccharide deacetylase family protein [bacterium]|nr:polysaccharide deacetylase family protein [bacterium]
MKDTVRHKAMFYRTPAWLERLLPGVLWGETQPSNRVYLSFDDGPNPRSTMRVADVLRELNVRAAFFLRGDRCIHFPTVVERLARDGHSLGYHGWSHEPWIFPQRYRSEIDPDLLPQGLLYNLSSSPRLYRPPYGRFSPYALRWIRQHQGLMVLWRMHFRDWSQTFEVDQERHTLQGALRGGDLLLLHDHGRNSSTLPGLLHCLAETAREMNLELADFRTLLEKIR